MFHCFSNLETDTVMDQLGGMEEKDPPQSVMLAALSAHAGFPFVSPSRPLRELHRNLEPLMKTDQPQSDSSCVVCFFGSWEIQTTTEAPAYQSIRSSSLLLRHAPTDLSSQLANPRHAVCYVHSIVVCAGGGQARKGGSDWHWSAL